MVTGIVAIDVCCFLCNGKGYHRKLFKKKSCWMCGGKGSKQRFINASQGSK